MPVDQTLTLKPGQNRPSAVFYKDGRFYVGGRTAPAWLTSLKADDFSDQKSILFPVELNSLSKQPKYNVVLQFQWLDASNELLVLFSGSSQLTIAAVNPVTLEWRELVSTVDANDILSFWTDQKSVFVSGYGQADTLNKGVISQFPTSDWQQRKEYLIADVHSQYAPLGSDGVSLYYVNGLRSQAAAFQVWKAPLADLGHPRIVTTPGSQWFQLGSDMVPFGGHMYLSTFYGLTPAPALDGLLLRLDKNTQLVEKIDTGLSKNVRGFWPDNAQLWLASLGIMSGASTISRYANGAFQHFDLPAGEKPELLVGDGQGHLFGVERGSPGIVRRYATSAFGSSPTPQPKPALILASDSTSLTLTDGTNKWKVPTMV